jgi:hypothetical protein
MIRFLLRLDKGKYLAGRSLVPRINCDKVLRRCIEALRSTTTWTVRGVRASFTIMSIMHVGQHMQLSS